MNDDERRELLARALTGIAFSLAVATSALALDSRFVSHLFGSLLGVGGALGLAKLWGDRTRPKNNVAWLLIIALLLALLAIGLVTRGANPLLVRGLPAGLLVGLFLAHDQTLAPTLMLTMAVALAVFQPDLDWPREPTDRAWWVASTVLVGVVAATFERERLRLRDAPLTPIAWTTIRLGFVAIFTITILSLRENLHIADLFAAVGADPRGAVGRWFLLAILAVSLVTAAFLFRSRPKTPVAQPGAAPALTRR